LPRSSIDKGKKEIWRGRVKRGRGETEGRKEGKEERMGGGSS
jgi:hypothetical protein